MTKITIPDTADLLARIAELEAERDSSVARWAMRSGKHAGERDNALARITHLEREKEELSARVAALEVERTADHKNINLKADFIEVTLNQLAAAEAALDAIITEATSRNHAIDIARRAIAEGGE